MLAEDTDTVEAPTMSQEPRPARRLVLVGGRSGRGFGESRRDPSGHVNADADTESWPQGESTPQCPHDSEGSDGEVEESVAGDEEVHVEDEEEEREVVNIIWPNTSHVNPDFASGAPMPPLHTQITGLAHHCSCRTSYLPP